MFFLKHGVHEIHVTQTNIQRCTCGQHTEDKVKAILKPRPDIQNAKPSPIHSLTEK